MDTEGSNPCFVRHIRWGSTWDGMQISPDGKTFAFRTNMGLRLMSFAERKTKKITCFGGEPSFSPDGQKIAFMNGEDELWTLDLSKLQIYKLLWDNEVVYPSWLTGRGNARKPQWSPDGRLIQFSVTHTYRTPKSEYLKMVELNKHHYKKMPTASKWRSLIKTGIVDVYDKKVWLLNDYSLTFAFSSTGGNEVF